MIWEERVLSCTFRVYSSLLLSHVAAFVCLFPVDFGSYFPGACTELADGITGITLMLWVLVCPLATR